jgi:hypothetical protein
MLTEVICGDETCDNYAAGICSMLAIQLDRDGRCMMLRKKGGTTDGNTGINRRDCSDSD